MAGGGLQAGFGILTKHAIDHCEGIGVRLFRRCSETASFHFR